MMVRFIRFRFRLRVWPRAYLRSLELRLDLDDMMIEHQANWQNVSSQEEVDIWSYRERSLYPQQRPAIYSRALLQQI